MFRPTARKMASAASGLVKADVAIVGAGAWGMNTAYQVTLTWDNYKMMIDDHDDHGMIMTKLFFLKHSSLSFSRAHLIFI